MKTGMRVCALLAMALVVSACGKKTDKAGDIEMLQRSGSAPPFMPAPDVVAVMAKEPSDRTERLLSYKHRIEIAAPLAQIEPGLEALRKACQAVPEQGCVVMESSVKQIPFLHAKLALNVRRAAVDSLRSQAVGLGKVQSQSTEADDVTSEVADSARRLAMNKALREDLLELRKQSRGNIDALIKATDKLAQVQSEIESTEGQLATLHKRVAMDDLTIELNSSDAPTVERHPVQDAMARFADNLASGLGGLIEMVAWSLPWLLLLAALPFIVRGLRRIWKLGRRG